MKDFAWNTKENRFFQKNTTWKLDVMFQALDDLNNPHNKFEKNVIHIAGTNGKGSVSSYIKTILENAGYKVGVFTSPHLVEFNERIYANGKFITDAEIERYKRKILTTCRNADDISFFEATTLIAILYFADIQKNEGLDYVICEVGLGGRLDATNIFHKPLASVITTISFDHMDKLGHSLREIAHEKGGIIKPNVPVFTSNTKEEIINELSEIAKYYGSPLYALEKQFSLDTNLKPSLQGEHQLINATLASEVCKFIGVNYDTIQSGIKKTEWKGRLQSIMLKDIDKKKFTCLDVYLDGAHNEDGIRVLCDFILKQKNQIQQKNVKKTNIIGILAVLNRKNYQSFFPILQKVNFDKLLFFDGIEYINDFVKVDKLSTLATKYNISNATIKSFKDVEKYLDTDSRNIVFIFGSLYFVGWILENHTSNGNR